MTDYILNATSISEVEQIFRTGASEYWTTHYLFGKASPPFPKYPGEQFITTLIINVVIPFLNALEKQRSINSSGLLTVGIMGKLKAESNQVLKNWGIFGIRANNAKESQALLQLYHFYCKQKRCLTCQIGADLVKTAMHEKD